MLRPSVRSPSLTSQESFSAVMITDLVADVNVYPETEDCTKKAKEETNLAFDSHMDGDVKSPPLNDTDSVKANGAGISKGVILNAMQFGSNDPKKSIDEKPLQLSANLGVPTVAQTPPAPKGFKDMTLTRKIAFGFSFLPSIFFVLCFAVILPCKVPKQCVEEAWVVTYNHTDPLSRLELTSKVMVLAVKDDKNLLLELDRNNGKVTEIVLPYTPYYLMCGKILNETERDCMVMDESGDIYTFNGTHSIFMWNPLSDTEELPPPPLIISGCNNKLDDIGVAVSNTIIKFLHGGNKVSNFLVTYCDSVPENLMQWKTGNSSDIVFVCDRGDEDRLVKIPRNAWCDFSQNSQDKPFILKRGHIDSLIESSIKPLGNNGLVLWSGNEISMILSNGSLLWEVSNMSYPEKNRFILHGKFFGEGKQLAFIGSNYTSGFQVIFVNPSDGSFVKKLEFETNQALECIHIPGKEKDYILLLLKKMKPTLSTMTAALTQISDISSTIVSLLSNEELYHNSSKPTVGELSILDSDGNLDTIKEIEDIGGSSSKSSMAATIDEEGILNIYLLHTSDNSQMKTTKVQNINVANWDKSTKTKCLAK